MLLRLASAATPPPMTPAPTIISVRTGAGAGEGSATGGSFFARSESRKMRTRFLHTGPTASPLTAFASITSACSTALPAPFSITSRAASGAG